MMQTVSKNALVHSCFIAVFLLLLSSPVWAQGIVSHSGDVAGTVGFSNLTGVDGNKHVNFGGSGGINLTDHLTVLGEYTYLPMGSVNLDGASASGSYQQFGGAARFNLGKSTKVVPYALGAFGYARQSANISIAGFGSGSGSLNGDYFGLGGGASIYLHKGLGVRPEFRYERQEFYQSGSSAGQNVALGTVSVFYQWGGQGNGNKVKKSEKW
jgi:hypothetical protein